LIETVDLCDFMNSGFNLLRKTNVPRIEEHGCITVLFHKSIANLFLFGSLDLLVFVSLLT
jgi:hypothetical protein